MSSESSVRLRTEELEARDVPAAAPIFAVGGGAGGPPRVQVYNVVTGTLVADFLAFENTFTGGVTTAIGDVNGDLIADLVIGASVGGGPRVKVIDGRSLTSLTAFPRAPLDGVSPVNEVSIIADFFAFEDTQRGGVNVAVGNFAGLNFGEIVVGAGPGGGPRVRILDGFAITSQGRAFTSDRQGDTVANFFAFEPSFRNGITVAATPTVLGGTQISDLIVAPGVGGGPRVRVLSGGQISQRQLQFTSFDTNQTLADFFVGDPNSRSGLYVGTGDFNRDGFSDIAVGTGPGVTGQVTIYSGATIPSGTFSSTLPLNIIDNFTLDGYTNGVTVGAAVTPNGVNNAFLLVGVGGRGTVGQVQVSQYVIGTGFLTRTPVFNLTFDPNFIGGVFVSV